MESRQHWSRQAVEVVEMGSRQYWSTQEVDSNGVEVDSIGVDKMRSKLIVSEMEMKTWFQCYMSHCQNSSKFLSIAYFMKTADVIMFFFSSHDRINHTC